MFGFGVLLLKPLCIVIHTNTQIWSGRIFSLRFGHEKIVTTILTLPLIQEGQLSVTGERMGNMLGFGILLLKLLCIVIHTNTQIWSGRILSLRFGHEKIATTILTLPLIQEEQLSVTGERMGNKY